MTRYREAFEQLAERGTPAGETAIIDRVHHELTAGDVTLERPTKPRMSGPLVAVLAFLTILVVGTAAFLLRGPQPSEEATLIPEVTWRKAPEAVVGTDLKAGPGGFVVAAPLKVYVSADGVNWDTIPIPAAASFPRYLGSTDDTWLLIAHDISAREDRLAAWVSSDGRRWEQVELPEELAVRLEQVVASSGSFLASVSDPFGEVEADLWLSPDGVRWEPVVTSGLPDRPLGYAGNSGGWVAWDFEESRAPAVYHSADAVTWARAESGPELAGRWGWAFARPDGGWLAFALVQEGNEEPRNLIWTSPDGERWEQSDPPDFDVSGDGLVPQIFAVNRTDNALVMLVTQVPWSPGDGPFGTGGPDTISAWVTVDGATWEQSQTFDDLVNAAAVNETDQGLVGVWIAQPRPDSSPVTTMVGPPDELDPEGVELQDEILADGEVTREEFERALAGLEACMEARGLTGVETSLRPDGTWHVGYKSPQDGRQAEREAIHNLCSYSYVHRVSGQLGE